MAESTETMKRALELLDSRWVRVFPFLREVADILRKLSFESSIMYERLSDLELTVARMEDQITALESRHTDPAPTENPEIRTAHGIMDKFYDEYHRNNTK